MDGSKQKKSGPAKDTSVMELPLPISGKPNPSICFWFNHPHPVSGGELVCRLERDSGGLVNPIMIIKMIVNRSKFLFIVTSRLKNIHGFRPPVYVADNRDALLGLGSDRLEHGGTKGKSL